MIPVRRLAVLLTCAALLLTSCGDDQPDPATQDPRSPEALRYGLAPSVHPDVTLQPDVVIVQGGGESVRSVSGDGLTWRLDADADGADRLEPGNIMFVTGRGVGRVLDLQDDGDELAVTIGPVTLTDVIRDGTFAQQGIVLDDPVVYTADDPFWARAENGGPLAPRPAPFVRTAAAPAAPSGGGEGTVHPTCCGDGIGVEFKYDQGGTKIFGSVTLTFAQPKADFFLSISGGSVTRAEIEISGGFGSKVKFEGGIDGGRRVRTFTFPVPTEWVIPLPPIGGIPLALTVSQSMEVTTAFGGDLGTIKGDGEFSLAGSLAFGYTGGKFGSRTTSSFKRLASLVDSLHGVPVGVMGLIIKHRVKFSVGFSAFVLNAGVFVELATQFGATMGSALGAVGTAGTHFVECRGVGLGVFASYGLGYSILEPVVNLVNKFLSLINVKPIKAQGGLRSAPAKVYAAEEIVPPNTELCGRPTSGGTGGSGGQG